MQGVSHYRMQKDNGHQLSGVQTIIFLELPKIDDLGNVPLESLNSEEKWCKFFLDADNPAKQEYVNRLTEAVGGIMEAEKALGVAFETIAKATGLTGDEIGNL